MYALSPYTSKDWLFPKFFYLINLRLTSYWVQIDWLSNFDIDFINFQYFFSILHAYLLEIQKYYTYKILLSALLQCPFYWNWLLLTVKMMSDSDCPKTPWDVPSGGETSKFSSSSFDSENAQPNQFTLLRIDKLIISRFWCYWPIPCPLQIR